MQKISLKRIWEEYFHTLRDDSTGKISIDDVIVQLILPFLLGIAVFVDRAYIHYLPCGDGSVSSNIITGVSIASALLCAVDVLVFQLRFDMVAADEKPDSRSIRLVDEIYYDVLWAIVIGFLVVALLTMRGIQTEDVIDALLLGAAVMCLANFGLVMCMSLKRMAAAYEAVRELGKR